MALTASQQQAVAARGNVIVVAGAGTGKTSTLVERCVALLREGCSIESILMVTFTDAAAAEMRHRLRLRLAEIARACADDAAQESWWQEQLALLDTARICTLHSFCLQLIRENFHLLGIDPAVKILDEQQVRPLIEAALDDCLAQHLGGTDERSESVRELIHAYGGGDLARMRTLVLKLHRYAQSLDNPGRWLAEQLNGFALEEADVWHGWLVAGALEWAELWLPEVEAASSTAENLARCARALRDILDANDAGSIGGAVAEILAAEASDWPPRQKTKLIAPFKRFFEEAAFLASQCETVDGAEGLQSDWANVRGRLGALLALAQEFAARFAEAKREAGGIDFADLEQFALRLLWDADGQLTPVANQCRSVLEYVFVDECQDINAAQDAILRAVSRTNAEHETRNAELPAGNRFLVGDVKQSIYQFRLARPALFLGYENEWSAGRTGERIPLSDNFRSAPEIIGFVNALFDPLMRRELGGVEYLPLQAGRAPECSAPMNDRERAVEFHLIPKLPQGNSGSASGEGGGDDQGGTEVDDLLAVEREARMVALRLRELHRAGIEVWDKEHGRLRRVEWRDMAVLLRSPSNRVEAFAQEFHRCGVPLQAARGGFLQSTEITDLLSLLRLLDNPLQDIPLLAVLRSPFVAMSLDELAEVRISSREKRFWTAVQQFHSVKPGEDAPETTKTAWAKLDEFLARFTVWRQLLRQTSLSQCLERALVETDYEALVQAGERGVERMANVRRLVRMVREYDPYQRQGLFRFLQYLDALIDAEQDVSPAPVQTQNAVRLMSIHQSKGLEFPVVAVACLGTMFNLGDLHQDVILDEQFGLCAKAVTPNAGARYPTLAHWLAARRQRQQVLGEELRLLYVATTRARDRLLLTATATRKDCETWESVGTRQIASREMLSARSPLDWLLLWLPTVTATQEWNDEGGVNNLLRWRIWREAGDWDIGEMTETPTPEGVSAGNEDREVTKAVVERIRWKYPQVQATHEPAKTSVTALRRKAAELLDDDAAPWFAGPKPGRSRPKIDSTLGAAKVGTLHHRFLQRMDLVGACNREDLGTQLAAMVERGGFTHEEAKAVEVGVIARFWSGDVGRMILGERGRIRREEPFTARFTLAELEELTSVPMSGDLADEFVVVQGVADLLVVKESELWLLDFKTDEAAKGDLPAKLALYQPQISLYAAALQAIHRKPVTRRWLHFLRAGETLVV